MAALDVGILPSLGKHLQCDPFAPELFEFGIGKPLPLLPAVETLGCDPDTQALHYCEGKHLRSDDCAAGDQFCGWEPLADPDGGYACGWWMGAPDGWPPYCAMPDPSCPELCADRRWECGPDGAGGLCGVCPQGQVCDVMGRTCVPVEPGCYERLEPGCGGCRCEREVCKTAFDRCCGENGHWDSRCVELCEASAAGCGPNPGCGVYDGPGCGGPEVCPCESVVCQRLGQASCCKDRWDEACAALCEVETGCGLPAGCQVRGEVGCDGCACEGHVCAQRQTCCSERWDSECVDLCVGSPSGCGARLGTYPAAWGTCDGCPCEEEVHRERAFCRDGRWDFECAVTCLKSAVWDLCGPEQEVCNGRDDDCNGFVDEGFRVGMGCDAGQGPCRVSGVVACDDVDPRRSVCSVEADEWAASDEHCDGLDNDCDGEVDEDFALGVPCQVGIGACRRQSTTQCDPEDPTRVLCPAVPGEPARLQDLCTLGRADGGPADRVDNDCDGEIDEGLADICDDVDSDCDWRTDEQKCGGYCVPCADGEGCQSDLDCLSRDCGDDERCHPSCSDGLRNGEEQGIDCGPGCEVDCGVIRDTACSDVPLDTTVVSTIDEVVACIYTGADPAQQGVAPGTIEPRRVALLRGRVLSLAGEDAGLPAVHVSVLGREELGHTHTRTDGAFDLVVNGGGELVVRYRRPSYLPVDRRVRVPWREYVHLPDVTMGAPAPGVEEAEVRVEEVDVLVPAGGDMPARRVELWQTSGWQAVETAAGREEGAPRRVCVLVPDATQVVSVADDGREEVVKTRGEKALRVSVTEFTLGERGPSAMPAELPPTSAYTYAAEFSLEGDLPAGTELVEFRDAAAAAAGAGVGDGIVYAPQALPVYVDNFLGFPVGTAVPVGYYDRTRGRWMPSENGRVIRVVSTASGLADLVVTERAEGAPADAPDAPEDVEALGITEAERARLAELYPVLGLDPPVELWRVPMTHFSTWDCNWPWGPPDGAGGPDETPPEEDGVPDESCGPPGSMDDTPCEDQMVNRRVPLSNLPFDLHYNSGRAPGRRAANRLRVPLRGPEPPPTPPERVTATFDVAGVQQRREVAWTQVVPDPGDPEAPEPVDLLDFRWEQPEGPASRPLQGSQPARVEVCYHYQGQYYPVPADQARSFAVATRGTGEGMDVANRIESRRGSTDIGLCNEWKTHVGAWDAKLQGFGGWTLTIHHGYDPNSGVLYMGDGSRRRARSMGWVIETVAGLGVGACCDGPTAAECLNNNNNCGDAGEGLGPPLQATEVGLNAPGGLALDDRGSLYVVDTGNRKIRRVDPEGFLHNFPRADYAFGERWDPRSITISPDGTVYVGVHDRDLDRGLVYRFVPDPEQEPEPGEALAYGDGMIWVGGCHACENEHDRRRGDCCDDGCGTVLGSRWSARLGRAEDLTVGPDGALYILDAYALPAGDPGASPVCVRAVGTDGVVRRVAGGDEPADDCEAPYGMEASLASLRMPSGIAVGRDGALYIADRALGLVHRVGIDGVLGAFAGRGPWFQEPAVCRESGWWPEDHRGVPDLVDDVPAIEAWLAGPEGVAVEWDGGVLVAEDGNERDPAVYHHVRRVGSDGIIRNAAGSNAPRDQAGVGDGYPATAAKLRGPTRMVAAPDGSFYVSDTNQHRVRRVRVGGISWDFDGRHYVPSPDGSQVFVFERRRHEETRDAITGRLIYDFAYDRDGQSGGRLVAVREGDGRETRFERDDGGEIERIVPPAGPPTELLVGERGRLERLTLPGGRTYSMAYESRRRPEEGQGGEAPEEGERLPGLLTSFSAPGGAAWGFEYDDEGRLVADGRRLAGQEEALADPLVIERNDTPAADPKAGFGTGGHEVRLTPRNRGRQVAYRTERRPDGVLLRRVRARDGTETTTSVRPDGTASVLRSDRVVREMAMAPDARWGMEAPVTSEVRVCYPDECPSRGEAGDEEPPPGGGPPEEPGPEEPRRELTVQVTREQEPDPNDPARLRSRTETISVQDGEGVVRTSTQTYLRQDPAHGGVPTLTTTSPLGRKRVVKLAPPGRNCEQEPCPRDAFLPQGMEVPPWTHDREELPGLAPVFFHRRYEGDRLESVRTWHMGDERLRAQDVRFDEEGRVRSEAEGVAERMINPWETRKLRYEYDEAGIVTSQVQSYEGVDERRTDYGHDDAGELTCLSRPRPAGDEDQGNACEGQAEGVLHRFEYDDRGRVTAYDPPDVPGAAAAGEVCGVGPEAAGEEWDRQVIAYEADGRTECTGQAGGAEVTFDWRNQRWPQEVVLGGRTTGSVRFSRDRLYPGMPIKEVRRSNEGWPADLVVEHYYAGPQLAVLRWADAPDRAGTTPIGFVQLGHEPGGFGARGVGVSGGLATCHERDADNLVASVWLGDEVPSLLDAVAPPRPDARRTVTEELGCDAGAEVPRTMQIEHRHAAGLVTGTELGEVSTTLAHDEFGGLVEQVAARSDGVTLYSAVLDRDDRGRIQCRTEEVLEDGGEVGRETCYGYDRAGRLAWVQEGGDAGRWVYEYDANGNRLREGAEGDGGVLESPMEYQVDDQDRLLLRGGIRYVWTPDGSLCRKIPPVDGVEPVEEQAGCDGEAIPGETRYLYDALGNLLRVDLPGGHRVEYRVDGMNRRVVRGSHEWQGGRLVDERLAYVYADKLNPMGLYVEGRDPDGEPTWRLWQQYVYATRDNVPDLMLKDGRVYRIVADHLGSVRLVVDVDSGVVAQRLRYDAFGRVLEDTDPGFQPFGFAGGLYDRMTGLVRFGARDYDPEVGRWTAKDPIGFEGGDVNLFGYVFGDPLNGVDSSGLDVYKCEAVADVPFNPLRWTHAWIKTDTVEAGMGPADGGIPGVDGRSDSPYATTGVADHTGEAAKRSAICRKVSDVDEWRVNRALRLERRLGRWTPWNQCHSFVDSVLRKARRSAPPETPWWTMLLRR